MADAITSFDLYVTRPETPPRPPDELAYTLFRNFTRAAEEVGITVPAIADERALVIDLHDALDDAQEDIRRRPERHDDFDYLLGFGIGHVLGALGVEWRTRYVTPLDWRYKAKLLLDGIIGLAKLDDVLGVRLQNLYEGHLASSSALAEPDPTFPRYTFGEDARPLVDGVSDRFEDLIGNLRVEVIDQVVRRDAPEVKLRDAGGQLRSFVSGWLTYAVSGIEFVSDMPPPSDRP